MRKIIAKMHVTLDGLVCGVNGEMEWAMPNATESLPDVQEFLKSVDTMILGRVTYEGLMPYWTAQTGDFADWMNITPKVVISTTLTKVEWGKWNNAVLIHDDLLEKVKNLKQEYGKDMIIFGGTKLIQSFTNLGFIDEYLLYVVPVILGGGKPLFEKIEQRRNLQLLSTKTYPSGTMALHYQVVRSEQ
jgi:dihydrofolate reductase